MTRSEFSDAQAAYLINQAEGGTLAADSSGSDSQFNPLPRVERIADIEIDWKRECRARCISLVIARASLIGRATDKQIP